MEQQKEPPQEPQERPQGHSCPECGTPRKADNTPSCACGLRAADALRDARTAQAAAAEDFDPLRIRPYVELDGSEKAPTPPVTGATAPSGTPSGTSGPGTPASGGPMSGTPASGGPVSEGPASAASVVSPSTPPTAPATRAPAPGPGSGSAPDPDATMTLRAVDAGPPGADTEATSVLPMPLAPSTGTPSAHDLRMFETSATTPAAPSAPMGPMGPGADGTDGTGGRPRRGRRRGVLLSAAGAVVVVVGAAGYASGLFSYESPSRDGALPDEVRASVPDPSTSAAAAAPEPSLTSARPTASPSPSPSASASASSSPSPSPSPSAPSASPTPSPSAEPTRTATSPPAENPTQESEDDDDAPDGGGTLHRGDRGSEVAELQQRLAQLYLYMGDVNGTYNRQVEDAVRTFQWARGIRSDELGVYGQDTRRQLESETRAP
ncbi:peptidoglycan-binding protein [Streptomyces sp. NPDC000351]|uniref:peptidoglycan-binding domain-containing protein n=1 Tax=Streptomyces sp. NPDC000351 TaxID=3154250 RepID=UPI00331B4C36